ncbi:glycoside hydrolase family 57 protein [Paramuribaculum intestinale]|jgi:alpha-amylase|uniref:Alpha-amylase n=4 Tax=Paramuribaculum intestinale TaxID=2094151 RepID=A0A2V1J386_9BACT|nr:glycoside hydrolase family 57 protein [Paramuribaculum intestinale]ROS93720.1 alpha-amylase [Muribaculaceae bacterium Isolate-043 (Harlan)]RXE63223.1 alpha-amylase [Muribaculaceae bacterium Isolate-004 (NCI)]PWB09407.1 alpha-amylase [Paramuribaculum intestinale]PWB12767.1 alpha-amylase [Paramuribaculum intestinale]WLT41465.1 glycoside hydrolase family 57 protein [Paramuribaculum intestinale]
MKAICFYFQIHQPFRLKRYRFFDIGNDHYYYDDFANDDIVSRIARNSYIPAAESLLRMIDESKGAFRCAISVTGTALEQFEHYVPEFIDLLKRLAETGKCEFLAETYAHSLSSLADPEEFAAQVKAHDDKIEQLFGVKPKVLRNTELIYCDEMAPHIYSMGYKGVITEGAKHILGWKSPNYVYAAATQPKLKLLLKNSKLSDDISFRFSNPEWDAYPLTADKYIDWIASTPADEQIINLFMNLETFGEMQSRDTGIFQFLEALPRFARERGIDFWTPSEAVQKLKAVGELSVMHPISWADEARDTSAWLGNKLQQEAFDKLYSVAERVRLCDDRRLKQDWNYLQASDHFFYMATKHFADGAVHSHFSPYDTPFQAFTNYMNVLADFIVRVEEQYPLTIDNEELNSLLTTIRNQEREIEQLNKEVSSMRQNLEHYNEEHLLRQKQTETAEKPAPAKKKPGRKPAAKKA